MPDSDKNQDQILAAAAEVIIRLGYDKTTMSVRQITAAARAQMEQIKQAKDIKAEVRSGATHDKG